MSIFAGLTIALVYFLLSTSCSQTRTQPQTEQEKPATSTARPSSPQKDRTAIPELKGCTRDQTTFYRGKVLLFRRTPKSIEITIRTEWDTTEKLVHSTETNPVEYRLQNHPISAAEFRQIESRLKDHSDEVRAAVWVCQINDSQHIRIIDWEPTENEAAR
jgi:hypothetical protein